MATLQGKVESISLLIGDLLFKNVPLLKNGEKTYLLRAGEHLDTKMFSPYVGQSIEVEGEEDHFCRRHAPSHQAIFRVKENDDGFLLIKSVS